MTQEEQVAKAIDIAKDQVRNPMDGLRFRYSDSEGWLVKLVYRNGTWVEAEKEDERPEEVGLLILPKDAVPGQAPGSAQ